MPAAPSDDTAHKRVPPGPDEAFNTTDDLLSWLVRQFERYGNIYKATINGFSTYVLSDPRYADHVLRRNWQNYTKGWTIRRVGFLLGKGLMVSEGTLWQSQRRMIQPSLHRLPSFQQAIVAANAEVAGNWTQAAQRGLQVNVTRDTSLLALNVILGIVFGDDTSAYAADFRTVFEDTRRDLHFAQNFRALRIRLLELIGHRRRGEHERLDLLGMLMSVRSRDGQAMSDPQLMNEIMTLVVAGHETTASTLNWIWYLLARHPSVEQRLSREIADTPLDLCAPESCTYANQVIEEVLRLYPPGWLLTRRAIADDQVDGYFVPAGTEIYISPYLIQRNPEYWPSPSDFDPDRFEESRVKERHPLASIPFSAGPRNCVGEALARAEIQLHLATIARSLRLRYEEAEAPRLVAEVNLRSARDFLMTPELKP
jgi:cytochrome P450